MTAPDWYKPPASDVAREPLETWQPRMEDTVEFWPRVGARSVDLIVAFGVGTLAAVVATALRSAVALPSFTPSPSEETLAESVGGATVGKLLLGFRVRMVDGAMCSVGGAFKRSVLYLWDAFFFGMPAHSSMKSSMMNQRNGDRWGNTIVVRASSIPAPARADQRAILGALLTLAMPFLYQLLIRR